MPRALPKDQQAIALIRTLGGTVSTTTALRAGIHRRTLYALRERGDLLPVRRGLFRLAEAGMLTEPDLVAVASRHPRAVVCLLSALSFHDLTEQIPHAVAIALPFGARRPRLDFPPIEPHWFSGDAYAQGQKIHELDGQRVRIYTSEKTIADCFKFRRDLGLDTCIAGLRAYRSKGRVRGDELIRFARVCRVESIMRPHLDSILG